MKVLAIMLFSLSLPGSQLVPKLRMPSDHVVKQEARKPGKWYFAETGHAVFCYGPVMTVKAQDGLQRVATFCKGDRTMVPLKD
jgi:hypothetical protein